MSRYTFAIVVEGEMVAALRTADGQPNSESMVAAFRSGPVIVEILDTHPDYDTITAGWTFDGQNWAPPVGL